MPGVGGFVNVGLIIKTIHFLIITLLLLAAPASLSADAQIPKSSGDVVARISIEKCLESEVISVPVNRSYFEPGKGVTGGGSSRECGTFSYSMHAMRQGKRQAKLSVTVRVNSGNFEREITLTRRAGTKGVLGNGIRVVVSY
jgi:hypothetical protein